MTFKLDLDRVKVNHHTKYLRQRSFVQKHRHTKTTDQLLNAAKVIGNKRAYIPCVQHDAMLYTLSKADLLYIPHYSEAVHYQAGYSNKEPATSWAARKRPQIMTQQSATPHLRSYLPPSRPPDTRASPGICMNVLGVPVYNNSIIKRPLLHRAVSVT